MMVLSVGCSELATDKFQLCPSCSWSIPKSLFCTSMVSNTHQKIERPGAKGLNKSKLFASLVARIMKEKMIPLAWSVVAHPESKIISNSFNWSSIFWGKHATIMPILGEKVIRDRRTYSPSSLSSRRCT